MMIEQIKELIESDKNGQIWFYAYGEIDDFLFNELDKVGEEFPIIDEDKPELNTIEAIKLLIDTKLNVLNK